MIPYILQGIVFGFAAAVQPGPLQAYIILQTLKHGWRRTIVLAIVPLLSDMPIIAVVVFVLAAIPNLWVIALRVIGGAFLLHLAASAVRSVRNAPEETECSAIQTRPDGTMMPATPTEATTIPPIRRPAPSPMGAFSGAG